ncbi:Alkaline phosphatase [hydrothermal vent metagenome]|uniref:Alkaline phosphatase n=1 Tax=hydrothermal vent metagenome TaxID=652676 RepID=A0A3B1D050_9ZZZZ
MKHILTILSSFLFLSICLYGQVINVPDDQPTIQEAINASVDGDTVLVADGTYFENINYRGKAITVASWFLVDGDETHIDSTIINGSQPTHPDSGSVVQFGSGTDSNSVLYGFTITGGSGGIDPYGFGSYGGGGIAVMSGAKIQHNKITGNTITHRYAIGGGIIISGNVNQVLILDNEITNNKLVETSVDPKGGGGIACYEVRGDVVLIANNVISGNIVSKSNGSLTGYGGGIDLENSVAFIRNNLIRNNKAENGGGVGLIDNPKIKKPFMVNNTIVNNYASGKNGGIYNLGVYHKVVNSIIWGNKDPNNKQISDILVVEYSDVEGGFVGRFNLDTDPLFADTTNFYLATSSSCIDAGDPNGIFNDIEDPNNPGFPLYPALGDLRNDMGAYGGNPFMIYAEIPSFFMRNCSLNSTYQVPGIDTLIVTSEISRPENQLVEVQATITSFDDTQGDSIPMVDNGVYPDNIANDGIYSGFWSIPNNEEDYNVDVSTYLSKYEYLVLLENAASFTTKGPLTLENMEVTVGNKNPTPPERIKFSLTFKNNGITDTVHDVDVNIILPDNPLIANSTTGVPMLGDIAPGESLTNTSRDFALTFLDSCKPGSYEFGLEITSNDVVYWYDTFTIDVVTGVKNESRNLPNEYSLEQNYPNPFNPSTTIKYAIPRHGGQANVERDLSRFNGSELKSALQVQLKVYDILGREVATLVNEQQKAGYYEVNFNASSLTSGIYFYKLNVYAPGRAGSFVETKKMILLR